MKILLTLLPIVAMFSLSSCSLPLHVKIYNGYAHDVELSRAGEDGEAEAILLGKKSATMVEELFSVRFTLKDSSVVRAYPTQSVPEEFVEGVGFVWPFYERRVKAQLEPDGCIYLVEVKSSLPASSLGRQPYGFPLCGRVQ